MDLWTLQDIKRFKEISSIEFKQAEKAIYDLLGEWLQQRSPSSKIYVDPGEFGIDVIQSVDRFYIGYEVKMAKLFKGHIDPSPLFQGIGQAIHYLHRGMDRAYLVLPVLQDVEYFKDLFQAAVRLVGLILFDRHFNFEETVKPADSQLYSNDMKKILEELLSTHRPSIATLRLQRFKEQWTNVLRTDL